MTYSSRLNVAPGTGRLVRRDGSILFVPDAQQRQLIERFLAADSSALLDVLADSIIGDPATAPSFVFIDWPLTQGGDRIQIIVHGGVSVTSDMGTMASLSGADAASWVEHRVLRNPDAVSFESGALAEPETDLHGGVVAAGGFRFTLSTGEVDDTDVSLSSTVAPVASAPAPAPDRATEHAPVAQAPEKPAPDPTPTKAPEPVASTDTPASAVGGRSQLDERVDRLANFEAAAGADWMEESLHLGNVDRFVEQKGPAPEVDPPVESRPAVIDDPTPPSQPDMPSVPQPAEERSGPPAFPGDPQPAARESSRRRQPTGPGHDEVTLNESPSPPASSRVREPLVHARLCAVGHPNPPHASACRTCNVALDDEPVTVDQPTLAEIELPDGRRQPLRGTVVIGRNPTSDAARSSSATLVEIDSANSVSRTHLRLVVDGWQVLATDCGSSGGTALLPNGDRDPIRLGAWLPHEVNGGDRLFLGGAETSIVVHDTTHHDAMRTEPPPR